MLFRSEILYVRGLINGMLGIEAIRTAQARFGNKPMTGEQVRWGLENLNLSGARIKELGFEGMLKPIRISCSDHEGAREGRVQQWDGKGWKVISDWYTANQSDTEPLVEVYQHKASSECRNGLSGVIGVPDEQCEFEQRRPDPIQDCGDGVGPTLEQAPVGVRRLRASGQAGGPGQESD